MSLFSQIFILLVSLTGLGFGILLSYIAPEEMKAGKKYFLLFKRIVHLMILGLIGYFIYTEKKYGLLIILGLGILLFSLRTRIKDENFSWYSESANYLIFVIPYFFIESNLDLLLAVLIFIYGLPTGTMIRKIKNEK